MELYTAYRRANKHYYALNEKDRLVYDGRKFYFVNLQTPWRQKAMVEYVNPNMGARRADNVRHLLKFVGQLPPGKYSAEFYNQDSYTMTDGERELILPYAREAKVTPKYLKKWKLLTYQK